MNQNHEKIKFKNGEILPLMDTFTTIQGEGFHSGRSAHFLRIGGCDIGCHFNLGGKKRLEDYINIVSNDEIGFLGFDYKSLDDTNF